MRAVASYILKGPSQAVLSASVPAAFSVAAPFLLKLLLIYFTAAVIALVCLRLGAKKGLIILLAASAAALVAAAVIELGSLAKLDLWNAVLLWGVTWATASMLYLTRSLALTLEFLALVSLAPVVIFFMVVDQPRELSRQLLEPMRQVLVDPAAGFTPQQVEEMMGPVIDILPGSIVAYTVLGIIISLFIARSWQAGLFNPGAWQQEFRLLRLNTKAAIATMILFIALMFVSALNEQLALMLENCSVVIGMIVVVFGLSIVHGLVASHERSGFWLGGVYVFLFLLTKIVAPVLMVLALSDVWVDYRQRFSGSKKP